MSQVSREFKLYRGKLIIRENTNWSIELYPWDKYCYNIH